jgi:hypothetical protein
MVVAGAVRGNELALLGSFRVIDGQQRRNLAVLDARSGRLLRWAPSLPGAALGQGFSHVVFTPTRLVAGTVGSVAAWRDGESAPTWLRRFPTGEHHDLVPEIAAWRGSVVAASNGQVISLEPASGHSTLSAADFRWSEFQNIGGRLFYQVKGTYAMYGRTVGLHCGQESGTTAPGAPAGTTQVLFVAAEPVDADAPAPPGKIFACSRADGRIAGFTPPTLSMPQQFVWSMAVVGSHLLVFTSKF